MRAELHNDLETPARALLPELDRLFQTVAEAGHSGLRLSGSGSTCFLAFTDDYAAGEAAHQLTRILARDRVEVLRVRSVALDEWAVIRDDAGYPGLLPGADAP